MLLKKSLVALKRLGYTIEEAIQLVQKQIRQRCTVRQDFESPLYISDQLRLEKAEVISWLPQVTCSVEQLGISGSPANLGVVLTENSGLASKLQKADYLRK